MKVQAYSVLEMVVALGLLAVVLLALMAVLIGGVRAAAQSKSLAQSTQLAQQLMEQTRSNLQTIGPSYLPAGTYRFDGKVPHAALVMGGLPFPPPPYPSYRLDNRDYYFSVYGQELAPDLRSLRVEVRYGETGVSSLETHFSL